MSAISSRQGPVHQALAPAAEHAAIGDELPTLAKVPGPFRWVGRAFARGIYSAAVSLTKRQKAYNLSVLDAVTQLADRVQSIEKTTPVAAVAANPEKDCPRNFNVVYDVEGISWMSFPERVLVYGLTYGVRPQRVLEIGTFQGGSARIMVAAMDDYNGGKLYCVDPNPRMTPETLAKISHRATIIAGPSPEALLEAEKLAGAKFDFALIDGDHSYEGVVRDIEGTLPVLLPGTQILFHDAHYEPVQRGIDDMKAKYPSLSEVGMLSTFGTPDKENPGIVWGGIRVLRYNG